MIPNASICAPHDRKKIEIASAVPEQVYRRTGPKYVIFPRNDKKKPIVLAPSLVASTHVPQEATSSILSLEHQQVRAGLLIAMKLAASEPTSGAIATVDIDDKPMGTSNANDPVKVVAKAPRSRRNSKKLKATVEPVPLEKLKFLTIAQTAVRYPAYSEKALRHVQAQAEAYQRYPKAGLRSNGFINCIIRPAGKRKIIIDAEKFELWMASFSNQQ